MARFISTKETYRAIKFVCMMMDEPGMFETMFPYLREGAIEEAMYISGAISEEEFRHGISI